MSVHLYCPAAKFVNPLVQNVIYLKLKSVANLEPNIATSYGDTALSTTGVVP